MTRINCINPEGLCQQHLLAEYRELPRVFNLVKKAVLRKEKPTDPKNPTNYVLGTGHVRFFYPRLQFLLKRQYNLIQELNYRGIKTSFSPPNREDFEEIPNDWFNDWVPTKEAIYLNKERIDLRMPKKPIFRKELCQNG